jgi:hypothetical protein
MNKSYYTKGEREKNKATIQKGREKKIKLQNIYIRV